VLRRSWLIVMLVLAVIWGPSATAYPSPLSTAFTYQGQLTQNGSPLNDTADFQFSLWDALNAGSFVGGPVAVNNVSVTNGQFTVAIDFGSIVFDGEARWLQIAVRSPAGTGTFTTLTPRQPLTAQPYSVWSLQTRGLAVDDDGQVGIGTSSPTRLFHVQDSTTFSSIFASNFGNGYGISGWNYGTSGGGVEGIANSATGIAVGVKGHSASANGAGVEGFGPVGVRGIGDGTGRIGVLGLGYAFEGPSYGVYGINDTVDGYAGYFQGRAHFSDNVGIGTTAPSEKLQVVGNICASGTIGACSDARFKHHTAPIENVLSILDNLHGVCFDWDSAAFPQYQFSNERQIGFIAQDVLPVLPEVVSQGNDGYYSVDYGRLTPLLVEAVKSVRAEKAAEIASLQAEKDAEIASLHARLDALEEALKALVVTQNSTAR
jgi:hypothetical protein